MNKKQEKEIYSFGKDYIDEKGWGYLPDIFLETLQIWAEKEGYEYYEGRDENLISINTKGMGYLDSETLEKYGISSEENEEAIELFAKVLEDEIPYFTIEGRMGGHWGIAFENFYPSEVFDFDATKLELNLEEDDFDEDGSIASYYILEDKIENALYDLEDKKVIGISSTLINYMKDLETSIYETWKMWQKDPESML